MSLILEALRKSEAERRLGQAPDVLAPMPVMHAPSTPSRRRTGAVLGMVLALSALVLAGWWLLGHPHTTAPQTGGSAEPSPAIAKPVIAKPAAAEPPAIRNEPPSAVAPTRAAPVPVASPAAVVPAPLGNPRAVTAPAASPVQPAPRASPAPMAAKAGDAGKAALASAEKRAASLPSYAGSSSLPADTSVSASPAAGDPELLPVAGLSASQRAALPALKVTMHVYADDPAQRFMIVDGQRVGEGARLGEGIVLVRIRRDGAEIDAHGRRLLLPNP